MAKKTKAELVEEGKALSSDLADVRKTEHSFALYLGADGPAFVVHKTKDPNALRVQAKQQSGGSQGAVGKATVDGKLLKLKLAEGESPPAKLGRAFKMHLKQRGIAFKIELLDAGGNLLEGDEEDAPAVEGEDSTTPTPDPDPGDKDLRQKLEAAFAKMVPLIRDAKTRVSEKQFAALMEQVKIFKATLDSEEYPKALAALNNIRTGFVKVTKPEHVTDATPDETSGVVADLLEKVGTVNTVVTKVESDPAFFGKAKTQLTALRTSLKTAIASNPAPEDLAKLTKMKEKLDGLFLNDLKTQGHGPQRHEGDVTPEQLDDRCQHGINPQTGTAFDDDAQTIPHGYSAHATKFNDPGTYVDAEEKMRSHSSVAVNRQNAKNLGRNRYAVEIPLKEALGDDYKTKLSGKTRKGTRKNPTGSDDTDFTDGTLKAIYVMNPDGSETLLTMFPNPKP
jgi:hypothetical protein